MPPIIDKKKCIDCGICADVCCMDVFKKSEDPKPVVYVRYPNECWHCRACAMDCPREAITMRYPLSHMMFVAPIPGKEGDAK